MNATESLEMYIGKAPNFRAVPSHINTTAYFRGTIDEVGFYAPVIVTTAFPLPPPSTGKGGG